ncbi:MAG: entericidin EcnA/B family protein [Pseudomonadota bacterium]
MKKIAMMIAAVAALAACNTVEGVAEDVKQTSQAVRRAL